MQETRLSTEVVSASIAAPWLLRVEQRLCGVTSSDGEATQAVVEYVQRSGGKRLRPLLVLLSARAFGNGETHEHDSGLGGSPEQALTDLAVAVELVHVASLLHDDLVDGAAERRGMPTVVRRWGPPVAVLSGDYLFSAAFELLVGAGLYDAVRLMSWALRSMCESEIEQLHSLDDPETTEDDYLSWVRGKTASLFAAACAAGAGCAGADPVRTDVAFRFGQHLGTAYQLADDLMDVIGDPEKLGKPTGQDLGRGLVTLPVIWMLRDGRISAELRRIISCRGFLPEMGPWLREQALASGTAGLVRQAVGDELERAMSCLRELEGPARRRAEELLQPVNRFILRLVEPALAH